MVELWAVVAAWATPTAVFLLLNCLVALTFIFASRTDRLPPRPTTLLSHASSFNFSKLIHNSHTSAPPPEENERASSHLPPVNSFNRDAGQDTHPATDEASTPTSSSVSDVAVLPETKRISRAPYLLSRITSFKGFSLHRFAAESSDPPDPVDADPAGQRITRADTEPRLGIKDAQEETKMKRSLSEKEHETVSSEEEVDTMADDFINRFRQQLRLQRLDSLLRFRRSAETTGE